MLLLLSLSASSCHYFFSLLFFPVLKRTKSRLRSEKHRRVALPPLPNIAWQPVAGRGGTAASNGWSPSPCPQNPLAVQHWISSLRSCGAPQLQWWRRIESSRKFSDQQCSDFARVREGIPRNSHVDVKLTLLCV